MPDTPPESPGSPQPPLLDYRSRPAKSRRQVALRFFIAVAALVIGFPLILFFFSSRHVVSSTTPCAGNLRQIGSALYLYSIDNHCPYPPTLQPLLQAGMLQPRNFICPETRDTPTATGILGPGTLSFIYIGSGMTFNSSPDAVTLYEPLSNHHDGIYVLYADGHVNWLNKPDARKLLAELSSGHNPPRPEMLK